MKRVPETSESRNWTSRSTESMHANRRVHLSYSSSTRLPTKQAETVEFSNDQRSVY